MLDLVIIKHKNHQSNYFHFEAAKLEHHRFFIE